MRQFADKYKKRDHHTSYNYRNQITTTFCCQNNFLHLTLPYPWHVPNISSKLGNFQGQFTNSLWRVVLQSLAYLAYKPLAHFPLFNHWNNIPSQYSSLSLFLTIQHLLLIQQQKCCWPVGLSWSPKCLRARVYSSAALPAHMPAPLTPSRPQHLLLLSQTSWTRPVGDLFLFPQDNFLSMSELVRMPVNTVIYLLIFEGHSFIGQWELALARQERIK